MLLLLLLKIAVTVLVVSGVGFGSYHLGQKHGEAATFRRFGIDKPNVWTREDGWHYETPNEQHDADQRWWPDAGR